jgi:hypothetical protein
MPDIFYSTKEEAPEGLRESLKDTGDGKFVVSVVPKVKLDEFRENNVNLSKERDTLKTVRDAVAKLFGEEFDLEKAGLEVSELRSIAQQVKDGKLTTKTDVEQEVLNRVGQMKTGFEEQIKTHATEAANWKTKYSAENQRYKRTLIDRAVLDVILDEKSGVNPSAKDDILSRAYGVWHVEDGDSPKMTPKSGDAILYGADGASPMSPHEWVVSLREKSPHLFRQSAGGGAGGQEGGALKQFGGMSQSEFNKLTPLQKLEIANAGK